MLEEAQRREMTTRDGKIVNDWRKLREFYTTRSSSKDRRDMYACAIGVFESSPGWVQDQTSEILIEMGWEYDPLTMTSSGKKLGNGFVEKMISRKRSNLRRSLRKCCYSGRSKYKLRIVRPEHERLDERGHYVRRKAGYTSPIDTSDAGSDDSDSEMRSLDSNDDRKPAYVSTHTNFGKFNFNVLH